MDIEEIREQFPQLRQKAYGKPLVYLDSAATSLRPQCVIDKWNTLSTMFTANVHRAVHYSSSVATQEYEAARDRVRDFINAEDRSEIVFTSGTTASVNMLASMLECSELICRGDEIIIAESEHHSDIVPWQMLCGRTGASIKVWPVRDDGTYDTHTLETLMGPNTRLCCVAQVSNVLGQVNPIKETVELCHKNNCLVFVDGAQGIVHCGADVRDMGCDFYAFSGHKIYAATGTGILYGRKELLEKLKPSQGGGEMIDTVRWSGTTYAEPPVRFEAGTPNYTGASTFVPALDLAAAMRESADRTAKEITEYLMGELPAIDGLRIYGTDRKTKVPLFSFSIDGVHHEDLALILDKMGIAVRSGEMCAAPLMERFSLTGMVRASFASYNTMEEAEVFIASLKKAVNMLR